MSDITIPKTPTPGPAAYLSRSASTSGSKATDGIDSQEDPSQYHPMLHQATSSLTPPPSSQIPKRSARSACPSILEHVSLSSPPATLKTSPLPRIAGQLNFLPSLQEIADLPESGLRELVSDLISAISEARMSAAHAKLQHSLLAIETAEAANRAAVEHEMTRREVEVLQAGHPMFRGRTTMFSQSSPPQVTTQHQLEIALKRCSKLEDENSLLEHRLKQAKKVIKHIDGRNGQLVEDNQLLRHRIKQNREHIDAMRSCGVLSINATPQINHSTPSHRSTGRMHTASRREGGQDPFDALLIAGQVLNAEANSVPSTPTHPRQTKIQPGHLRGAHSLSSLPTTPNRSRPLTADKALHTPSNRILSSARVSFSAPNSQLRLDQDRNHDDRDSTISASDHEDEAFTDDDVPASQASQAATSMLRRFSGAAPHTTPASIFVPQPKPLTQSKILGKVVKPGFNRLEHQEKRIRGKTSSDGDSRDSKKTKLGETSTEQGGLGIGMWPSPGH